MIHPKAIKWHAEQLRQFRMLANAGIASRPLPIKSKRLKLEPMPAVSPMPKRIWL